MKKLDIGAIIDVALIAILLGGPIALLSASGDVDLRWDLAGRDGRGPAQAMTSLK